MMNTSTEVLRITRWCYPNFVWNKPVDGGILWQSQGSYLLKDIANKLPPIKFITNFSAPIVAHPALQTIYEGHADLDLDYYQHTHERYQYVDFVSPFLSEGGVWIWSSKSARVNSKILNGVFDDLSSYGILLTFFLFALLSWIEKGASISMIWTALDTPVRALLRQPPHADEIGLTSSVSGGIRRVCLTFAAFFFSTMYFSVVVSLLSVATQRTTPNSLEDLAFKFPDLKIYVPPTGIANEVLRASTLYPRLQHRVEEVNMFDRQDGHVWQVFSNLVNGSHVYIEIELNVWGFYITLNEALRCQIHPDTLKKSSTPLSTSGAAAPIRKGSKWLDLFNTLTLWLEAYGIRDKLRNNGGFFSNETTDQTCDEGNNEEKVSQYPAKCYGKLPPQNRRLTLPQLWPALACWAGCISLSIIAFALEIGLSKLMT